MSDQSKAPESHGDEPAKSPTVDDDSDPGYEDLDGMDTIETSFES